MNIGKLNKRIKYKGKGTQVSDGYGGQTVTDGAQVETWGEAKQLSMSESLLYGLPEGTANYWFRFHYAKGVNILQGSEIEYDSRTFRVTQVMNKKENDREIEVIASERK